MHVSPVAFFVAVAAGAGTGYLAWRALRGTRSFAALGAALARGAAVALAVVAAFAPFDAFESAPRGRGLVAAPDGVDAGRSDLTLHWPADAPDAASALETLRAARDADSPAALSLAVAADVGRGRDAGPAARALRPAASVDPSVLALPSPDVPRASLPSPRISAPSGAVEGIPVSMTLDAGDVPFAGGEASIEVDGRATRFAVAAGARQVPIPPLALSAGTHLVVVTTPGRLPGAAIVEVAGPPRVTVVCADEATREIAETLRAQGLDVAAVFAGGLRAEDVEHASVIVLGPGAAGDERIAARVRGGGGLLALGGVRAAGIGRFRDGPIDSLLPVTPPPPPPPAPEPLVPPPPVKKPDPALPKAALDEGEKSALRVALLLVIDVSGSMAGTKLQMAQQSAIAAAAALSPEDRVSVWAFNDDAREVAPFQDAVEMKQLFRRIGALEAGGGTNYFWALKNGYRKILEERCGIRHVILLSDGETDPAEFQPLIEGGVRSGVTLSTIAIGDGANTSDLSKQATWGHGKMYRADDPQRLPEVVTLDTRRFATGPRDRRKEQRPKADAEDLPEPPSAKGPAGRDSSGPPAEKPPETAPARPPHLASRAAFLAGLEESVWPAWPFEEATPARPASQVALAFDAEHPALTIGRAGLGRVAVVSASLTGEAAHAFRRWPLAPQFLAQLVRGLATPPTAGAAPVEATIVEADDGRAFVRVSGGGGGVLLLDPVRAGSSLNLRCEDRGGFSQAEVSVVPAAGVYAGTFAAPGAEPRRALAVSPGPRGPSAETPLRIASMSGAPIVPRLPVPRDGPPRRREEPAGLPLVAAAAGLLVVEAALRRAARAGTIAA